MKKRIAKRKIRSDAVGFADTQTLGTVGSDVPIPPKPKVQKTEAVINVENVNLSFLADFKVVEGVDNKIWPEAEKLLFPAARHRLHTLGAEVVLDHGVELLIQLAKCSGFQRVYEEHEYRHFFSKGEAGKGDPTSEEEASFC